MKETIIYAKKSIEIEPTHPAYEDLKAFVGTLDEVEPMRRTLMLTHFNEMFDDLADGDLVPAINKDGNVRIFVFEKVEVFYKFGEKTQGIEEPYLVQCFHNLKPGCFKGLIS